MYIKRIYFKCSLVYNNECLRTKKNIHEAVKFGNDLYMNDGFFLSSIFLT